MGGLPVQQMRHDLPQTEGAGSMHGAMPSLSIGRVKTNPFHRTAKTLPGLALTLSLALMSASTFPAIDSKAGKFYEDALTRYEKKDYPGAIVQLKSALQADRSMLPVHVLLGKTLMANGEVVAAEAAFTEALRLGVNRTEIAVPLARAVMAQGRQKEVVEQERFQLAGLSTDTQVQMLLVRSSAFSDLGDMRSALKSVEDARAIDPSLPELWLAEVPIRIRAGQFTEALAVVAKARALNPAAPEVHYQQASILHVQGDLPGAMAAYDKAIAAEPNYVEARVARAGLLLDLRRNEEAAKDVSALLARAPGEARGWYLASLLAEREGKLQAVKLNLRKVTDLLDPAPIDFMRYRPQILMLNGLAHYGLGEREKATPYLEAFQHTQPGSPVSKLLANIYMGQQNHDKAIESLDQYLRAHPGDAQAMALLASAHMAKGRHARAANLMQEALRGKDAAELHTAYGLSLMGVGQSANALTELETAYKKDPGQTQAAFALVGIYLRSNQAPKALAVAKALVTRQPSNPSFHNLLALAKTGNRDTAGARASFEQAIALDPTLVTARINLARLEIADKKWERSKELLDGVLKADERNTEAMYEMAVMAERQSRPDDAQRWLQKAFDVAGTKDMRSSLALVDLHMRQGRPAEALKIAQRLAANVPDDLAMLMALTRVQLANGDVQGAKNSLTTATRVANFDAPVQVEIALLQLAARNLPGAAYSLDKALSTKADYLPAQVLMAEVETKQGEFAKAEARIQQIIKKEPRLHIGYSLNGDLALARKQPQQAVEHYRRAFQAQPSSETLSRLYGALVMVDPKAASEVAERWSKDHPGDLAVGRMLAEGHVRRGDLAAARTQFEKLRQLAPKDTGLVNDLANVLIRLKDPKALEVAEQALAAAPNSAAVIDTAGWAALQAGKLDRALQLLRDARLRDPDSRETRYHLAAALVKSGRKAEAKEELDTALRGKVGFDGREDAESLLLTLK